MTIKTDLTRRSFIKTAAVGASAVAVPMALTGCGGDDDNDSLSLADSTLVVAFGHGVASGDPLADKVIIWTRITHTENTAQTIPVEWKVATDAAMTDIVSSGIVATNANVDYTVKVDADRLLANTTYYYQFTGPLSIKSTIGTTKTLPVGYVESVKLAVCSCANYPAGYFNAYDALGKSDADVVVHLGDYIYEYAVGEYGTTANTIDQGRNHSPEKEVWTLADYRMRYAQYRQDTLLQGAHQTKPFICVWDDHELANDSYKTGAANHTEGDEGTFTDRRAAAFQAYHEWLPIRTGSDVEIIYRNFKFGELISMNMMDTRHIARDAALTTNQLLAAGSGAAALIADPSRRLIGDEQLNWLIQEWSNSTTTWEVLGQQVLMGRIFVPIELLLYLDSLITKLETGQDASAEQAAVFSAITELATIKAGYTPAMTGPATADDLLRITSVAPYNLDSWDGYFVEREQILKRAALIGKNVISLAGDTHNAWASDLRYVADTATGRLSERSVGAEFATSSVSSPGFDEYLSLSTAEKGGFEGAITALVDDLKYFDSSQRGYMEVVFTPTSATAEWKFVSTIQTKEYDVISSAKQRFRPGQTLETIPLPIS
jgi:alkaline phosphatase D